MAADYQIRIKTAKIFGDIEITFFENSTVMGNQSFVPGLSRVGGIAENRVARESHFAPVYPTVQTKREFGLAGHPVHSEFVILPSECLAGFEGQGDKNRVKVFAIGR